METVAYRSYVVRAWGRGHVTVRVLVEDVQTGRRFELRGDRAARLVAQIEDSLSAVGTDEWSLPEPSTDRASEGPPKSRLDASRGPAEAGAAPPDRPGEK